MPKKSPSPRAGSLDADAPPASPPHTSTPQFDHSRSRSGLPTPLSIEDLLHGVYQAGTHRVAQQFRDARDRFVASDPGWSRLKQGLRAFVAVGTTLLLELLLAKAFHRPAVTSVLLGAVVAMLMSTGIRETERKVIARTAVIAPLLAAAGAALGVVTAEQRLLGLSAFVAVSFFAVWVRRFGQRWFTLGFLLWQAFFFTLFLRPPIGTLPFLLLAIAVSGMWVTVLLLTVLYDDPQSKVRSIVTALRARARSGIAAAAEVVETGGDPRSVRQLRRQLVQLAEIALLLDGQLADPRSLPDGVPPGRLRRWTVDVEIGMDEVAGAAVEIAGRRHELTDQELDEVREVLQALGWADHPTALRAAQRLASPTGGSAAGQQDSKDSRQPDGIGQPDLTGQRDRGEGDGHRPGAEHTLRRLGTAAVFLLETVALWQFGELGALPAGQLRMSEPTGEEGRVADVSEHGQEPRSPAGRPPADALDEEDDFEPAVALVGGNLPGSAALAQQTLLKAGAGRFSASRLRLTTRQAIQAGLAAGLSIIAGELISPARFYWAVIAAFMAFAGTATSGETVLKGASRIGGTVLGLVGAVGLADVTDGHRTAALGLILVCIFCAFFLQTLSYGAMIFFITVLLGQLYTLLGTFSDELLLLRLAETVAGAAIGIVVSLVVLPTHTRATVRVARRAFLTDLSDLLEACAQTLDGAVPARSPLTLTMMVEASGRQLVRTRRSMTRGRLFGADRTGIRHRISVLGTCGACARAFAAAIVSSPLEPSDAATLATVGRELAVETRRLAETPELSRPPQLPDGTLDVVTRVRTLLDARRPPPGQTDEAPEMDEPARRAAVSAVRRLVDALALLGRMPAGR